MNATPRVSIIVPCRNERRHIAACLESIRLNDYPSDSIELVVVDGASDDGTREVVEEYARRWPKLRCLDNPATTTPAALNIGVRNAQGEIIMRMDAHCHYPRSYISALVKWLDTSGADNVGGVCRTLPGSETSIARAIAIALSHPFGVGNSRFRIGTERPRWVDTVPFGCYRRSVFERIGLFDEELIRNQDDEFNQRLLKNGGRILLVPDVVIEYYARESIRKVARMYYQYGYFKPLVARKLGRIGTVRQVLPVSLLIALAATLILSPWSLPARLAFAGILGSYALCLIGVTTASMLRNGFRVSSLLPIVFPVLHFSYGWGSLRGIVSFSLRRVPVVSPPSSVPVSR